ncbi:MAG: CoA transferase [Hyphomicrobiales bacterium]|nr:CoA transferase [Hyphomicrobiales bacterium]
MVDVSSAARARAAGPLRGLRVVEFFGLGPGPFACMLLSDMGADVVTIDRPGVRAHPGDFVARGRRRVALDLKQTGDLETARTLIARADVLVEGFRPGVMERIGLGPTPSLAANPRLVYARMTGWGQEGPLAHAAGHDINYVAITGALDSFRARDGEIVSPLNLVGDYGGGALYLAMGALAAVIEARASGRGQVVDVAMCDGVASLMTMFHSLKAMGAWPGGPRANMLDGGAHYYRVYACKDGGHISIGAIEPQFYAELLQRCGIEDADFFAQNDRARWEHLQDRLEALFLTKTRAEWSALLEGTDACAMAVQTMEEAPRHPHLAARQTFIEHDGRLQPAPAPRFSRTPGAIQNAPAQIALTPDEARSLWS